MPISAEQMASIGQALAIHTDDGMEGMDGEEKLFLRERLAEFDRKRGQFLDEARKDYWSRRGTDEEDGGE